MKIGTREQFYQRVQKDECSEKNSSEKKKAQKKWIAVRCLSKPNVCVQGKPESGSCTRKQLTLVY